MLERIGNVARKAVKATILAGAVAAAYAGYEFYEGGKDRVHARYEAARETTAAGAGAAWDKTKTYGEKTADRLQDDPTSLLLIALPVLLTVLYYRAKGHPTGDALVAAVTRTPPAARTEDGPLDAVGRAKLAGELKQLKEYRAELAKQRDSLPKEVAQAERWLKKATETEAEAEQMHDEAVADRQNAEKMVAQTRAALERALAEEDALKERVEELARRLS